MAARPYVVYADIVGDLFHAGHVSFLERARALGTERGAGRPVRLVVGVVADAEVASYKRLPVLTLAERVAVIEACRLVDEVVADCPVPVTEDFLREQAIDLVVHGDDLDEVALEGWYGVPIRLGRFETVPYSFGPGPEALSTSAIIERVLHRGA